MTLLSEVLGWKNTDRHFFSPGGTIPWPMEHEKVWSLVSMSLDISILKGALTCRVRGYGEERF